MESRPLPHIRTLLTGMPLPTLVIHTQIRIVRIRTVIIRTHTLTGTIRTLVFTEAGVGAVATGGAVITGIHIEAASPIAVVMRIGARTVTAAASAIGVFPATEVALATVEDLPAAAQADLVGADSMAAQPVGTEVAAANLQRSSFVRYRASTPNI